jgi:hypothetical protein
VLRHRLLMENGCDPKEAVGQALEIAQEKGQG